MKCTACGNELKPNSKFCQKCGSKVDESGLSCPSCGSPIKEGVSFCGMCGFKFETAEPQGTSSLNNVVDSAVSTISTATDTICSSCGTRLAPDKKFCNVCGTPTDSASGTNSQLIGTAARQTSAGNANGTVPQIVGRAAAMENTYPPKKKKTGLIVTLIVVISLLLVAGGVTVYCYVNDLWFFAGNAETTDADNTSDADSSDSSGSDSSDGKSSDGESSDDESSDDKSSDSDDEKKPVVDANPIDDNVIRNIIANNSTYTTYGVYVYNISNGYEYGFNQNNSFLASAMGQIVILETVSRIADQYDIDINNSTIRFNYFANGKESPNSKNENGQYLSIKKYVEDVAVYGDNNKSNQLIDYIGGYGTSSDRNGFDVINRMSANRGYGSTRINKKIFVDPRLVDESVPASVTTPYDIAHMFNNLINNSSFGNRSYMMNIFRSAGNKGEPIGLKKYIPPHYSSCSANAINSQVTNDVAIISDGETEIVVAIFGNTPKDKTSIESNPQRENVQKLILEHILYTQFEK